MLSGCYRTEYLAKSCLGLDCPETIEHILIFCPSLSDARALAFNLWTVTAEKYPFFSLIIMKAMSLQPAFRCQFILDLSTLTETILLTQTHGQVRENETTWSV